jgi:SAM-dependent methyltransferase
LYDYGFYHGDAYYDHPLELLAYGFLPNMKFLCKFHKDKGKLFDVGCALGFFAKMAQESGFDAYGLAVSEYTVHEAKKLLGNKVLVGNAERPMPFQTTFSTLLLHGM